MPELPELEEKLINELVRHYIENRAFINRFLDSLDVHVSDTESLALLIHSVKKRMKEPDRLKDKLIRKFRKARDSGMEFHINKENLFTEINDLAGYRILHLHTRQMDRINNALLQVLNEAQFTVIEGPQASIWDQESQVYFQGIGISTRYNAELYSSVHYVVQPNSKVKVTIEIQVRTLSEEIWGEVDHKFNYPHAVDSVSCREQIKVLARVASSCTRLVDSIFASYADWQAAEKVQHQAGIEAGSPTTAQSSAPAAEPKSGDDE